jgi:hypothetical protein
MKILKKVLVIVALLFTSVLSFWHPLKKVNATTLPTGTGFGCAFNHNGTRLAVAHGGSPYITIYDTTTTPYTKLSNPTTLPASNAWGCAFNHDGTRLAVAHEGSPYITIYDTTTTPYTKLSNPTTLPAGNAFGCAFNHDGTRLAVAHISSPYITIYVEDIPVESIEIGFSGGKLLVGQTYQINPTVLPENATDKTVIYYSNNTEVATVSASGLVTAVATGTATITASAGGKSDTVVFTVVEDTYSAGYNDGYDDGYGVGYYLGYDAGYAWVLTQVYEYGISTVPKSDNTYYDNTESFDYVSGYGQAWGLGYDLGYSEGSGRPLTPEEEGIVYNWGYNAGYQAGQEDHSVGSLLKQAFGGVGQLLDIELLPNLTIGGIVIVPLLLGIVFFILKRG